MKKIKRYYLNYSDTEHHYSDVLTDRQYMWVDYCMCHVEQRIAKEIHENGNYLDIHEDDLVSDINDRFSNEDMWSSENYEAWYDENEDNVIENIMSYVIAYFEDYESIIEEEDYATVE